MLSQYCLSPMRKIRKVTKFKSYIIEEDKKSKDD